MSQGGFVVVFLAFSYYKDREHRQDLNKLNEKVLAVLEKNTEANTKLAEGVRDLTRFRAVRGCSHCDREG